MATYRVLAGRTQAGFIVATFDDGSTVTVKWHSLSRDDFGARQRYSHKLVKDGRTIEEGNELRSGVGEPINYLKALDAWISFAGADAESYQSNMTGTEFEEWCYLNSDELSMLSEDLKEGGNVLFG